MADPHIVNTDDTVQMVPVTKVTPHPRNPRDGNVDIIVDSIEANGFYGALVVQKSTGHVLAGNHRLQAAHKLGMDEVPVIYVDVDDSVATRILLADNRTSDVADYHMENLAELLSELRDEGNLGGTGYDTDDLNTLLAELSRAETLDEMAAQAEGKVPKRQRTLPVDAVFTLSNPGNRYTLLCHLLARSAGFQNGVRSTDVNLATLDRWDWAFPMTFVDNAYHNYDHNVHLSAVAALRPKYATVMDVMTRGQCDEAGIKHHSFDQIMRWAEELNEYAENVIIIPKYDCLADIPDKYVLGYSVKSSYGFTPIPAERFADRRVHLLGGTWKSQKRYLEQLGDAVVSLDMNAVAKAARFSQVEGGPGGGVDEILGVQVPNPFYVALALSFGLIAADLTAFFAGLGELDSDTLIDIEEEEGDDDA